MDGQHGSRRKFPFGPDQAPGQCDDGGGGGRAAPLRGAQHQRVHEHPEADELRGAGAEWSPPAAVQGGCRRCFGAGNTACAKKNAVQFVNHMGTGEMYCKLFHTKTIIIQLN